MRGAVWFFVVLEGMSSDPAMVVQAATSRFVGDVLFFCPPPPLSNLRFWHLRNKFQLDVFVFCSILSEVFEKKPAREDQKLLRNAKQTVESMCLRKDRPPGVF